jgi:menaquinol-cytochrome c reductase iron-sulfur subunit
MARGQRDNRNFRDFPMPNDNDSERTPPSERMAGDGSGGTAERSLPKAKMPGQYEGETFSRRALFSGGALAAGGIATAAIVLPAIGFAVGPVFEEVTVPWQDAGAPDDFSHDTYIPKTMTLVSGVGEAGKTTVYIRKSDPKLFASEKPGEFIALSTRCAHLGCPVRWVAPAERFVCPCHGGVYDFQGKPVGGPPVRPLDRFKTRVHGRLVQIGARFSVNSQLKAYSPRDPGESVDGLWQYLYPKRFTVQSPSS